jgi:hypothetical protein
MTTLMASLEDNNVFDTSSDLETNSVTPSSSSPMLVSLLRDRLEKSEKARERMRNTLQRLRERIIDTSALVTLYTKTEENLKNLSMENEELRNQMERIRKDSIVHRNQSERQTKETGWLQLFSLLLLPLLPCFHFLLHLPLFSNIVLPSLTENLRCQLDVLIQQSLPLQEALTSSQVETQDLRNQLERKEEQISSQKVYMTQLQAEIKELIKRKRFDDEGKVTKPLLHLRLRSPLTLPSTYLPLPPSLLLLNLTTPFFFLPTAFREKKGLETQIRTLEEENTKQKTQLESLQNELYDSNERVHRLKKENEQLRLEILRRNSSSSSHTSSSSSSSQSSYTLTLPTSSSSSYSEFDPSFLNSICSSSSPSSSSTSSSYCATPSSTTPRNSRKRSASSNSSFSLSSSTASAPLNGISSPSVSSEKGRRSKRLRNAVVTPVLPFTVQEADGWEAVENYDLSGTGERGGEIGEGVEYNSDVELKKMFEEAFEEVEKEKEKGKGKGKGERGQEKENEPTQKTTRTKAKSKVKTKTTKGKGTEEEEQEQLPTRKEKEREGRETPSQSEQQVTTPTKEAKKEKETLMTPTLKAKAKAKQRSKGKSSKTSKQAQRIEEEEEEEEIPEYQIEVEEEELNGVASKTKQEGRFKKETTEAKEKEEGRGCYLLTPGEIESLFSEVALLSPLPSPPPSPHPFSYSPEESLHSETGMLPLHSKNSPSPPSSSSAPLPLPPSSDHSLSPPSSTSSSSPSSLSSSSVPNQVDFKCKFLFLLFLSRVL